MDALLQVEKLAKPRGLLPLISDPHQLLQLPVSIAMQEDGFVIFCHIPLARPENVLTLYSYQSYPIELTNTSQLTIEPDETLLAVTKDHHHIELSSNDLDTCIQLGPKVLTCPHMNMLKSPNRPSCLSALFYADDEMVRDSCKLLVSPARDHVLPLSSNKFLINSVNESEYSLKCWNGTVKDGLQLKRVDKIVVPDNCVAVLKDFRISPLSDLYVEATHQRYLWKYPLEKLLTPPERKVLDKVIDGQGSRKFSFDHLKRLTQEEIDVDYVFPTALGSSIVSLIAAALLVVLCVCFCQSKNKYIASSRMSNDNSNGYTN